MEKGAEPVEQEGTRRRLAAVEDLGGEWAGRESTSCTGRPPTPWSTSTVPQQATRLTSIHPALDPCWHIFSFQIGFADQAGYGSGAASEDAGSQYEGSGTKSGYPNWADRCGEGCQGEPVQEVGWTTDEVSQNSFYEKFHSMSHIA